MNHTGVRSTNSPRAARRSRSLRGVAFVVGEEAARQVASRIVAKALSRPMLSLRAALERGEKVGDVGRALEQLFEARSERAAGSVMPSILGAPAEPAP